MDKIHYFDSSVLDIPLPDKFTYPFHYTPHPLCVKAAALLQHYLADCENLADEFSEGKMFGVLAVKDGDNRLGFLAAFSGNLVQGNQYDYFVPPVYDLLQPDGFFKVEERYISELNQRIEHLKHDEDFILQQSELQRMEQLSASELSAFKIEMEHSKEIRGKKRSEGLSEEEKKALIGESQFQKAEYKRLKNSWQERVALQKSKMDVVACQIQALKQERKQCSVALQMKLFDQFQMLNGRGETKSLRDIFADTPQRIPPAGAGECCAPKLLQYAFLHHLQPVAMAEFWWGASPKCEIRRHGQYYPACQGKCKPILGWMLQGLKVDENPLQLNIHKDTSLQIVYEDKWLMAVNKPAGMLSVPGKEKVDSVVSRMRQLLGHEVWAAHRLDMATSGLLLIAKNKDIYKVLQRMFQMRQIKKAYVAVLDGVLENEKGFISLPLCADLLDRPRQMVHQKLGKEAVTYYEIIEKKQKKTKIRFYPITGRTHQLRIHSAHPEGLNMPIVGDSLYGKASTRLYLHAESLDFIHPITGNHVQIKVEADF